MVVVKKDVMLSAGPLQLSTGLSSGCEAAVHAIADLFSEPNIQGILLVDTANAFSSLNRKAALHNISYICPALATVLNNCYRHPAKLIVPGEGEILSQEGTTQHDPLGMAMIALSVVPLILKFRESYPHLRQVGFADDASRAGTFQSLKLASWYVKRMRRKPKLFFMNLVL